jgi:endonuclease/exonuclease/phosphatase family metal-dependent hydrolase
MASLEIICWNIKGFSKHKAEHSQKGPDIAAVLKPAHVVFILEAPAKDKDCEDAIDSLKVLLGNDWKGESKSCGGLGNEKESVIVLYKSSVSLLKLEVVSGTWDSTIRKPVMATLKPLSGNSLRVAVWHAPPSTTKKALRNHDVHVVMGDFNADVSVARREKLVMKTLPTTYTTMSDPTLFSNPSITDMLTTNAYDKVFVSKKTDPKVEIVGMLTSRFPNLSSFPSTATTHAQKKDAKRAYAISDHLPVMLQLDPDQPEADDSDIELE